MNDKKPRWLQAEVGALRVFWLAFKPLGYTLSGVLDAGTSRLLCLHDGPLHHQLKGDLGVLALEACQHILRHYLRQGAALCLQLATVDFLQLQHLGSCEVKKWECGADLLHRIPDVEGTEAKGHPCNLGLAEGAKVSSLSAMPCLLLYRTSITSRRFLPRLCLLPSPSQRSFVA
jgi:hypothetical protein